MKTLLIFLLITQSCIRRENKMDFYIETNRSNGSRSGHYFHDGESIGKNKFKFIEENEMDGVIDTIVIQIETK